MSTKVEVLNDAILSIIKSNLVSFNLPPADIESITKNIFNDVVAMLSDSIKNSPKKED